MNRKGLDARECISINIMKAVAILSVIAAHTVSVTNADRISYGISALWELFGKVGVIIFFVIGGFLYTRTPGDTAAFWKKKASRIIVPWMFCSAVTYAVAVVLGRELGLASYFKWVLGSGTWYYYITVYTFFLFVFQWFYDKDFVLYLLTGLQVFALILAASGKTTTLSLGFFTDYLNPLHWIGYFSFGILIKKYRLDRVAGKCRYTVAAASLLAALSMAVLYHQRTFTYFHVVTAVFCLSALVLIAAASYKAADGRMAKHIEKIGKYSYCIYLLHMQIVQAVGSRIPESILKLLLSPFIGLAVMLLLISAGLWVCEKLPCGEKIKAMVGL